MLNAIMLCPAIVALRNEKGSYNIARQQMGTLQIVALRNEKGSYNYQTAEVLRFGIVALRNEKGSYNFLGHLCANS